MPRLVPRQPVAAGEVDGVVERRAAARPQVANRFRQLLRIVDQIGNHLGRGVETHHHGPVLLRPKHAVDELDGCLLLELEAVPNAVAGIDQDGDAQG